ncbi:energy-coupling factor ABC transporter permease [Microbacterium sp. No. 7]|uniref:energy-coupling factor ABC transporter permease n=1 Tax=Microbacterium sp. No. 7 TaxID=1714373 RepID=UPI0006D12B43|nr:energy-coupling factor ABC transporter permease [Microbacterium sp. No. 7]ALJ21572.1 cobalamin biosynthesis protein CbiM [Microbacterium sp. No. 7]
MHVPDGFLDTPTSVATGLVAAAAVGLALHRTRRTGIDERTAPLLPLVTTVVFAAQMVNFPVAAGTSGHLMGGVLAAMLLGPALGLLCLSVVLVVQAVVFADGGLTALGTNITLMGVVAIAAGWGVARLAQRLLPRRPWSVVAAAALGAFVSVPAASLAFGLLFAVGGQAPLPLDAVLASMVGWHALIGVGEALITAVVVAVVMATRPDLVHGARPAPRATRPSEAVPA